MKNPVDEGFVIDRQNARCVESDVMELGDAEKIG
jgi:hypothetical protein